MEAALLSLAAFCMFGVQADVEVDPNFDLKRFAGKWHVLALASTDPMLQSLKDIITTPAARIVPLPNGNLEIETYYLLGENCEGMKSTYMKTEQPGHFTASDEKGKKDLQVLASDANFAIVYVQWEMKGMPPSRSLQLYSKDPKGRENLDRFKAYCQKMGLMGELVVPPLSDKCFKQISGTSCAHASMMTSWWVGGASCQFYYRFYRTGPDREQPTTDVCPPAVCAGEERLKRTGLSLCSQRPSCS